jgi:hypothetical protein
MPKGRSTLIISVLLLCTTVPSLRCLIPTARLSAAERACCKRMAGECGRIPSTHECCKKALSNAQPAVTASKTVIAAPEVVLGTHIAASLAILLQPILLTVAQLLDPSPPPSTLTGLRI